MSEWLTWQLADSAFPTGLFAHSWGLESACQHGEVNTADDLRQFADAAILQTGHAALPFLNVAFQSPERLETLDAIADAFLTNQVANRASRVQGRTLLMTVERIWPSPALFALQARAGRTRAHVAPLSGATFRAIGVSLETTQRIVVYSAARGVLSAAVRLGVVGSYEAQRMLRGCEARLDEVAHQCAELTLDDVAQTAPLLDLLQSRHDGLYSRLFQS